MDIDKRVANNENMNRLTKLIIPIVQAPISLFEMGGEQDIDRTHYFESGWLSPREYFFMVPDGVYLCTQGNKPCVYEVANGQIKRRPVRQAPIGNTVEDLTGPEGKPIQKGETLADIMHVHNGDKKKKHK